MEVDNNKDVTYPVFLICADSIIDLLESPRHLGDLELYDYEVGNYIMAYDLKGKKFTVSFNKEDGFFLIPKEEPPDVEELIQVIQNYYIAGKKSSETFKYTGPPNDPVELYLQFEKHNSLFAKLKRFFKDFFGD